MKRKIIYLMLLSACLVLGAVPAAATPGGHGGGSSTPAPSSGYTGDTNYVFGGYDPGVYTGPWIGPAGPLPSDYDPGSITQGNPNPDIGTWLQQMWYTPGAFREWARETIDYGVSWTPFGTPKDVAEGLEQIYSANKALEAGEITKEEYDKQVAEGLFKPVPGSSELDYFGGTSFPELFEPIVEGLTPQIPAPQEWGTPEEWLQNHPMPSGPTYIGPAPTGDETFIGPAGPLPESYDFGDPGATQWYGW